MVEYLYEGQRYTQVADYCVSSIPLPVLRGITLSNFSQEFRDAIEAVSFAPTCKVGWQANKRFWENDQNAIYGGISWTDHNITQMWYPSNDYFSSKGTLTGAYNFGENAEDLGELDPQKRLEEARKGAIELHPEFEDEDIVPPSLGISIAWRRVAHQLGGWAAWDPANPDHMIAYKQLLQPEGDGRFSVMGDQVSSLPGWQEGAMMSAHYVIGQILGGHATHSARCRPGPGFRRPYSGPQLTRSRSRSAKRGARYGCAAGRRLRSESLLPCRSALG